MLPLRILLLVCFLPCLSDAFSYPILVRNHGTPDLRAAERQLFGLRGKETLQTRIDLPLSHDSLAHQLVNGSVQNFPSIKEAHALLDQLEFRYPSLLSSFVAGRSVEGRDMRVWVVGEDAVATAGRLNSSVWISGRCVEGGTDDALLSKPSVLLTALHHAREPASLTVTLYTVIQLLDLGTRPPVEGSSPLQQLAAAICNHLIETRLFLVVPFVNPDGYAAIETTGQLDIRKNRRHTCGEANAFPAQQGVDLNRNYDYNFDNLHSPCDPEEYEGSYAFSEPETQAIKCLVERTRPTAALNFHGYGGFWTRPYNCCEDKDVPEPFNSVYQELSDAINVTGFGPAPRMPLLMYTTTGEADDWMLSKGGVLAMSPEVGHERFGFWPPQAVVPEINEETFWHILDVAMKTGPALSVAANEQVTYLINHGLRPFKPAESDIVVFPPRLQLNPSEFFSSRPWSDSDFNGPLPFSPYAWRRSFQHRRRRLDEPQSGSHGTVLGPIEARAVVTAPVLVRPDEAAAVCLATPSESSCFCGYIPSTGYVASLVPLVSDSEACRTAIKLLPPSRAALYDQQELPIEAITMQIVAETKANAVTVAIAGVALSAVSLHAVCLFLASGDNAVKYRMGRVARRYAINTTGLFCCLPPCLKLNRLLKEKDQQQQLPSEHQMIEEPYFATNYEH